MPRSLLILTILAVAVGAAEQQPPGLQVLISQTRKPEKKDKERLGFDRIDRKAVLGNLKIRYAGFVKPDEDDKPIQQKYGDHFFGCDFGRYRGNGGWNLWDFLQVTVRGPDGKNHAIMGRERALGFARMQEGARGILDALWELPRGADGRSPGVLGVRLVKYPQEEKWFYLEVWLDTQGWSLSNVRTSCYPYNTSKDPARARERWTATLTGDYNMEQGAAKLDPATEWALAMYNHLSQEESGCLLVLAPHEIAGLSASGTYSVAASINPRPGCTSLRLAYGYFADENYRQALPRFRRVAPAIRKRLEELDFGLDPTEIATANLDQDDFQYLLGLPTLPEKVRQQARTAWEGLQQLAAQAHQRKLTHGEERRLADLAQAAREAHRALRQAWLNNLPLD